MKIKIKIDRDAIRRASKVRKPIPPPTQRHRCKKDYRRKPKHSKKEEN